MWKLKILKKMMTIAEKMALDGYCILTLVYPVSENIMRTKEQLIKLKEVHFKRIESSDAILVVNINNYIGESTNLEIDYTKKGKEIIYYTDLIENNQSDKLQVVKGSDLNGYVSKKKSKERNEK